MATTAGPRSSRIALDGHRLHYLEWGAPDAPALVLLHGLGALVTAHEWDAFAAAMQDTHRVIAVDQRGFGLSDRTAAYSVQLMARDLEQLVQRLELVDFSLVGHSMGGTVACLYAEARPEQLRRLVLEDTLPPRDALRIDRPDVQWEFADLDELLAVARRHGVLDADADLRARLTPAVRPMDGGGITFRLDPALPPAILAQLADPDPAWWRGLTRIIAPTLIVRGAGSQALDDQRTALGAAAIADCRVVVVAGAGHTVHRDDPSGFLDVVRGFLE